MRTSVAADRVVRTSVAADRVACTFMVADRVAYTSAVVDRVAYTSAVVACPAASTVANHWEESYSLGILVQRLDPPLHLS